MVVHLERGVDSKDRDFLGFSEQRTRIRDYTVQTVKFTGDWNAPSVAWQVVGPPSQRVCHGNGQIYEPSKCGSTGTIV